MAGSSAATVRSLGASAQEQGALGGALPAAPMQRARRSSSVCRMAGILLQASLTLHTHTLQRIMAKKGVHMLLTNA